MRKGGENYVLDFQTKREFNGTLITSAGINRGNNEKMEAELISNLFRQTGDNISVIARSGNRYMTSRYPDNRQVRDRNSQTQAVFYNLATGDTETYVMISQQDRWETL